MNRVPFRIPARPLARILVPLLLLVLAAAPATALKLPGAKPLARLGAELHRLFGEGQAEAMMRRVELVRQAGLSYAPELTVPLTSTLGCKSREDLRVLAGMLGFDANYALAFGHKDIFLTNRAFARDNVTSRLPAAVRLESVPLPAGAAQAILADPDDKQAQQALAAAGSRVIDTMIDTASKDPEVMDLFVDGLYGSTLEGLYVVCRLAMTSDVGPDVIRLLDEQADRVSRFLGALAAAQDDDSLAMMLDAVDRRALLDPILQRLRDRKGNMTTNDLEWILELVTPQRAQYAAACR